MPERTIGNCTCAAMPFAPESLSKAISNFIEGLEPFFRFLAFASLPGSADAFREAFEDWKAYFEQQDQALLAFSIQHGLIGIDRHFTTEQLCLLIRWTMEHGDAVVNQRLPEFFTLKEIETTVNGWGSIPYMLCRKNISSEAVQAYRMGLHNLVIPALLPLAEGLASEIIPNPCRVDAVKLASQVQLTHPSTDAISVQPRCKSWNSLIMDGRISRSPPRRGNSTDTASFMDVYLIMERLRTRYGRFFWWTRLPICGVGSR